jgi:hypothetical protein
VITVSLARVPELDWAQALPLLSGQCEYRRWKRKKEYAAGLWAHRGLQIRCRFGRVSAWPVFSRIRILV